MKLRSDRWRKKITELQKTLHFLLMMLGVEMLMIWVACHYYHSKEVKIALVDQMLQYTFVAGMILLIGLTDVILPKVKQSIKLIGISLLVYLASLIYFTFMPIKLLTHLDATLVYSFMYGFLVILLISTWRLFELSMEKKYKACIMKFQQDAEIDQ